MISKASSRFSVIMISAAGAALALGCGKSADSKGNGQPQATAPSATAEPTAGNELEPTPVEPESAADEAASDDEAAAGSGEGAGAARAAAEGAEGAVSDTEWYTVKVRVPGDVSAGSEGTAQVTIRPKTGWKLNHDFPTKLSVEAPGDVKLAKADQRRGDAVTFEDEGAEFAVAFTPSSAGDKTFEADLKFAVCTETTCDPKKEKLAWVVPVK